MASWYDIGSVAVSNGSATVTGTGTDFLNGARDGDGFKGPDGEVYEIASRQSATTITLGETYKGSTTSGAAYSIVPTQSLTQTLADSVSTLITDYQTGLDAIDSGIFKAANGTVTAPGITFASDLNTGIYSVAADNLGVAVSGVKVLDLVSTGVNANLRFLDSKSLTFGNSDDLAIFHDGGNSVIQDTGQGDLYIQASSVVRLTNVGATEHYAKFNENGAVQLYYDNSQKLATTSTGIDITGTVTTDSLIVDSGASTTSYILSSNSQFSKLSLGDQSDNQLVHFLSYGTTYAAGSTHSVGAGGSVIIADGNFGIDVGTGKEFSIGVNNAKQIVMSSSGNFLIGSGGTTTRTLNVYNASSASLQINGNINGGYVEFKSPSGLSYVGTPASISSGSNVDLGIYVNSSQKAIFDGSGNLTLNTGNLVIGTAGKGIDFSANSNATGMTSELLDDYEEGTWTPTLEAATTNPSVTYTYQYATYTKIGNLVTINLGLNWSAISGGSGAVRISGLPFNTTNVTTYRASCSFGYLSGVNFSAQEFIVASTGGNVSRYDFFRVDSSGGGPQTLTVAELGATGEIQLSGSYRTDS